VKLVGTGGVASAGPLTFLAGAGEWRLCLPKTRFLLQPPMGGVRGPETDIEIEAIEIIKMRERIDRIIARERGEDGLPTGW
jgi:ATP-dependent Clp protease protease subunit